MAKMKMHNLNHRCLSLKDGSVRYNVKRMRVHAEEVLVATQKGPYRFVVYWTPQSMRLRSIKIDDPIDMMVIRLVKRYLTFATGKCEPALT